MACPPKEMLNDSHAENPLISNGFRLETDGDSTPKEIISENNILRTCSPVYSMVFLCLYDCRIETEPLRWGTDYAGTCKFVR